MPYSSMTRSSTGTFRADDVMQPVVAIDRPTSPSPTTTLSPRAASGRPRVLVADSHRVVGAGLAALLRQRFELTGVVSDGVALVQAAVETRPDVIVTDFSLPRLNALQVIEEIRKRGIQAKVIVLTTLEDRHLAVQAFQAGASGFVLKSSSSQELIEAIYLVAEGGQFLTPTLPVHLPELLEEVNAKPKRPGILTPRQLQVLQLVGEGITMREAAKRLGISRRTAESHKYEIMRLLDCSNSAELVRHAIRLGLIGS